MNWLRLNWPEVVDLTVAHLLLSLPAIVLSVVVAVPIGRLAQRLPRIGAPLRSSATMVIALTIYGVALLVRTAADAFASVDAHTRDAALAIGHSPRSLLWRVDLPLAFPVLLSGIRVVTVSTIGLVTIGALIGVSSLGTLLTDGFQRGITGEVVTGVVATVVLALLLDGILVLVGRVLTRWRVAS